MPSLPVYPMTKRLLLALCLTSAIGVSTHAQHLRNDYITWPASPRLQNYVKEWVKGQPLTKTWDDNGTMSEWEDEEFFTSRVRLKPYIRNAATQVYEISEGNDKNLLFWVPMGNDNLDGVKTNALPNGLFDSEVFSMWSYVTHFGNWTSPYGWVPGGFADTAHKHGTAVSGVASIPNATLSGNWLTCLTEMGNMSADVTSVEKLGDFLAYHGVDGLGYNSEYNTTTTIQNNINSLHDQLMKYMTETRKCVKFENPWYATVSDNATIDWTSALHPTNTKAFGDKDNPRTIYFINYAWADNLWTTGRYLARTGRNARDLYMGMNMQSCCKFRYEWTTHATNNYSIGLWGAHDFNYLWGGRAGKSFGDTQKQANYQERLEQWFTNGNHNPADRIAPYETYALSPSDKWFGMSPFMSARSTLGWDLGQEPFVTFFNLGNGTFFNWKGQRCNDNEWYNIGVQDYMPTWRFWWATEILGNTPDKVAANGLKAIFTWDDAYVGGSCLRISGTSADEYLHLFKTQFDLRPDDTITIRYKLLDGKADVSLIMTAEGNESKPLCENELTVMSSSSTVADDGLWVTKTFRVSDAATSELARTIALVGLHFSNAENVDMYLGEFSIKRGSTLTPSAPVITKTKMLGYNMEGADGKIIFRMSCDKQSDEPIYNLDVNTSMFKLYAQYDGGTAQLAGITTSWAGICYAVKPDVDTPHAIRLGVSAVSADTDSESEISWSDYMPLPAYSYTEGIEIDKKTIKPGQPFTLRHTDTLHSPSTWAIHDADGRKVAASDGATASYTCPGLDNVGIYDVIINENTPEAVRYKYLVQVSSADKGALPEITHLTVNGNDVTSQTSAVKFTVGERFTLGYTGQDADGTASQGIRINNKFVGGPVKDLGIAGGNSSFSLAAWVKLEYPAGTSSCLGIENRADRWPRNNWGFFWMDIAGRNGSSSDATTLPPGGVESYSFNANTGSGLKYNFSDVVIPEGSWVHLAFTFDWNGDDFKSDFYINGVRQIPVAVEGTPGSGAATDDTYFAIDNKTMLTENMWFGFGGGRGAEPHYNDGTVDEVVVWDGAMTAAQVKQVMAGLDKNELPQQVIAYWDMENAAGNDHLFSATGSKAGAQLSNFALTPTEAEGAGIPTPSAPVYDAGAPFVSGTGFNVVTTPSWSARSTATLSDATGNDLGGSTGISFPTTGDYNVSLSLTNSYGSHSMDYPVFSIIDSTGAIRDVPDSTDGLDVHTINGTLFVTFATDGDYTVNVYDTAGHLMGSDTRSIHAGQNMSISLANGGVYIVNVVSKGRTLRSVKVLNR